MLRLEICTHLPIAQTDVSILMCQIFKKMFVNIFLLIVWIKVGKNSTHA